MHLILKVLHPRSANFCYLSLDRGIATFLQEELWDPVVQLIYSLFMKLYSQCHAAGAQVFVIQTIALMIGQAPIGMDLVSDVFQIEGSKAPNLLPLSP